MTYVNVLDSDINQPVLFKFCCEKSNKPVKWDWNQSDKILQNNKAMESCFLCQQNVSPSQLLHWDGEIRPTSFPQDISRSKSWVK